MCLLAVDDDAVRWRDRPLPVLCPIRRVTGRRCPGCGMTRAVLLVLGGHPRRAFRANPLWPLVLALVAFAVRDARRNEPPRKNDLQNVVELG